IDSPGSKWQLALFDDRDRVRQLFSGFFRISFGDGDLGKPSMGQSQIRALRRLRRDFIKPRRLLSRPNQISYREPIFTKTMIKKWVEVRFHADAVHLDPMAD